MVRRIALIALFLIFSNNIHTCYAGSYPWQPGLQLTWSDFQGAPDATSSFLATTHYTINYRYVWDGEGTMKCTVNCLFDQDKSWKKAGGLSDALLRHEQLHFNVAELFARKMRQAFNSYVAFHKHTANTDNELKAIYDRLWAECKAYNELYDNESDHSRNKAKQDEWDRKIMNDLRGLEQFAIKD